MQGGVFLQANLSKASELINVEVTPLQTGLGKLSGLDPQAYLTDIIKPTKQSSER
jgi:hypothetical protein